MSEQVILAIISLLGIIVTGWFSYKARQVAVEVKKDVKEYHAEVNGKVSKLLESKDAETIAKEAAALAIGELKGAKDNQERTDAKEQDKK